MITLLFGTAVFAESASVVITKAPDTHDIIGGELGKHYQQHKAQFDEWYKAGLRWFVVGDNLIFNFSAENFYNREDGKSVLTQKVVLRDLALWLKPIPKTWVRFMGFRDGFNNDKKNQKLAEEDAKAFATFFWDESIDARGIYTRGIVEAHPMIKNASRYDRRSMANRVEMVVSLLPAGSTLM
jgi:outer membrane protein OmpA-like peptidoglycan-associated protein